MTLIKRGVEKIITFLILLIGFKVEVYTSLKINKVTKPNNKIDEYLELMRIEDKIEMVKGFKIIQRVSTIHNWLLVNIS